VHNYPAGKTANNAPNKKDTKIKKQAVNVVPCLMLENSAEIKM
jgi:hypothetical protein